MSDAVDRLRQLGAPLPDEHLDYCPADDTCRCDVELGISGPVAHLRELGERTTEGRWTAKRYGSALHSTWHVAPVADMWGLEGDPDDREQEQANAEFIAAARNMWGTVCDVLAWVDEFAGAHDGHDTECERCQARAALDRLNEETP